MPDQPALWIHSANTKHCKKYKKCSYELYKREIELKCINLAGCTKVKKKPHTSVRDKAVKNQSFVLQCLMSTIGTGKIPYLQNFANLDGIDGFFDYF